MVFMFLIVKCLMFNLVCSSHLFFLKLDFKGWVFEYQTLRNLSLFSSSHFGSIIKLYYLSFRSIIYNAKWRLKRFFTPTKSL